MSPKELESELPHEDAENPVADGEGQKEEVARQQEPTFFSDERGNLKVVNFVVRYPCGIFWFLMILCFVITFLLQAIVWSQYEDGNPFTAQDNEYDIGDIRSIQYDSLRLAAEAVQKARDVENEASGSVEKQSDFRDFAYWTYEAETPAGLFTDRDTIETMKEAFDVFWKDDRFENWCLLDYRTPLEANETRKCLPPTSPLRMYYASEWDSNLVDEIITELKNESQVELFNELSLCYTRNLYCDLVANTSQADVAWAVSFDAKLRTMTKSWDMRGELVPNHTQATELAAHLLKIDIYKGLIDFGYDSGFSVDNQISMFSRGIIIWGGPLDTPTSGLTADEEEKLKDDEADRRKDFVLDNYFDEMERLADTGEHPKMNSYYFMLSLILDVILQIAIRDATLALFSIAFVFLWLRINTGSWFLATIGFFEILLSIPVSWFFFSAVFQIKYFATLNALTLFIVAAIGADDIFIFMDAYKQSKIRYPENLVDLETRMSWVYRRTGTAMAITSATTCAAFLCTLITPLTSIQSFGIFAAFVIFFDYVFVMTLFCTAVVIYHDRFEDRSKCGCCCPCGPIKPSNTEKALERLQQAGDEPVEGDFVSRFFRNKVAGFVKKPVNRVVIFVLFFTWLGIAIWQGLQLEATKETEQFLDEDNPFQKAQNILNKEFPAADNDLGLKVFYAWGLEEVDRSGVNLLLDPENYGKPVFNDEFNFNKECQTELLRFCDKLKTDKNYKDLIKQKNGIGEVYCFIEELAAYNVKGNLDDCNYVREGSWKAEDWQIDQANLTSVMEGFLGSKSCFDEDGVETVSSRYIDEMGWDGKVMKYAAVSAESSSLAPFRIRSESETRVEYDQFVAIAEEMKNSPIANVCGREVVMTDLETKFTFMNNQAIYVQTALQSSILGLVIAFTVLLISTRVFHIAFFASLSIASVLVSVVGTMVMLGWDLGSIESILIGIIAGFSVDYVVHLAHAYEIAEGDTYERITEAFADLGISVFNGMITSVAASIPLFFCQLQFFAKFGTFLCLTIAFSWIFANFVFMSIMATLKIPIKKGGCRL